MKIHLTQILLFTSLVVICFACKPSENQAIANSKSKGEVILNKKNADMELIYYFDALCGWCYGFSPVVAEIEQVYGDRLDIKVVSGGLFLGNRAGNVNDVAPHIKSGAYKSVEQRTGVKFGKAFIDDIFGEAKTSLNSLPPTIALNIIREKFPDQEVKFAGMLLKAVYYDGLDPIDHDGLAEYAAKIGFDKEVFLVKMQDEKYTKAAYAEFDLFNQSQFAAMPSLVLRKDGQEQLISHGYASYENVKEKLDLLLTD